MEENLKYLFMLFPVVGVGLFFLGIVFRGRKKSRIEGWREVSGTVIDLVSRYSHSSSGGGTVYCPLVEYRVDNHAYQVQSEVGYGKPKESVGSRMKIMYNPSDPSVSAVLKGYYMFPNGMIGMGAMFVFMGTLICYHLLI